MGVLSLDNQILVTDHLIDGVNIIKCDKQIILNSGANILGLALKLFQIRSQVRIIGKQVKFLFHLQILLVIVQVFVILQLHLLEIFRGLEPVLNLELSVLALEFLDVLPENEVVAS